VGKHRCFLFVCVFRREHNSFTADVKGVHINDMVTVCKVLVRPLLRLHKNGKYDWPSHAVIIIIIVISILITKQASSYFSVCFVESRKSVF
jgi:hypothetical protein